MKKLICLALGVLVMCFGFSACSSKQEQPEATTSSAQQQIFYDRNGDEYSSRLDVLFFDREGTAYKLEMVEDFLPDYVNQTTNEHLNGFQCYVDADGYFVYDSNDAISLVSGTTSTYSDDEGNTYYDISTVLWNSDGSMIC